jgi:putative MATE family efflux protein
MNPSHVLTTAPILPLMLRMSWPNMLSMLATTLVSVAETAYVGQLGTAQLAAMALVFPIVMLQQMLSAGSVGGGISAAVSRALGAGDMVRAQALAWHAGVIALVLGVFFTVVFAVGAPHFFALLGGGDEALAEATLYAQVGFSTSIGVWLLNAMASVMRAAGDMKTPSLTLLLVAGAQVAIGGALGLGWGPFPSWGMAGVAAGLALSYSAGAVFLVWRLSRASARVRLVWHSALHWAYFKDILRVGAIASISSIQTVLTIVIVTRIVAGFGTAALAGYGIGSRLEFMLVPITFAVGVTCVPLVGMALGAGLVARARQVAWTGAALVGGLLTAVGLVVAVRPSLWSGLFTQDAQVMATAEQYFLWVGPFYGLFGVGLCLYFASQGAGKLVGPVLAGTLRLVMVAAGGWWLLDHGGTALQMFALIGAGMLVYGLATAVAVYRSRWG